MIYGIGIDHGFGNMKTRNSIFPSGVASYGAVQPETLQRVVFYMGTYYGVGGTRMEVKDNKTQDIDYYILTLASIAEELKILGTTHAQVRLGVGLPLKRLGAEQRGFKEYLLQKEQVEYTYEGKRYQIEIVGVDVFAQGYNAVLPFLNGLSRPCLALEWGSWTVEVIVFEEQSTIPNVSRSQSIPYGMIRCTREIDKMLMQQFNRTAEQQIVQNIMLGNKVFIGDKYQNVIEYQIQLYIKSVLDSLVEYGFYLDMMPVIHLGGGQRW